MLGWRVIRKRALLAAVTQLAAALAARHEVCVLSFAVIDNCVSCYTLAQSPSGVPSIGVTCCCYCDNVQMFSALLGPVPCHVHLSTPILRPLI